MIEHNSKEKQESIVELRTLIVTIFEFTNRLGYLSPPFNVRYDESGTHKVWFINSGGNRCYITRVGNADSVTLEEQAADSHFMIARVGVKMRAVLENYATWAAGLTDAINFARAKLEPGFSPMKPQQVASVLKSALLLNPYP
jgi:hypothetical protein